MKRSLRRSLTVVAVIVVSATAAPAQAASEVTTRRLAGADRYETAAAIARATLRERDVNIVVARGDAFPDALSGVNAAGYNYTSGRSGAILLTPFGQLPPAAVAVLRDFDVQKGDVIGSTDVVSSRVEQQLAEMSKGTQRADGRDRYETNFRTRSTYYNPEGEHPALIDGLRTAFLTSGANYADAMTAGPLSYRERMPLLLTTPDRLSPVTAESLQYGVTIEQVVIVGGASAVSEQVVRDVEALGLKVRRVAGTTRQDTAVKMFEFAEQTFGWQVNHVNLARGDDFADAIAGGPHAGEDAAPILLTAGVNELSSTTRDFLRARSETIASIDVFGDGTAVSDAVVEDARRAATSS